METKPWNWNENEEDTSVQDNFWATFVNGEVDGENPIPVNLEDNDNMHPTPGLLVQILRYLIYTFSFVLLMTNM